MNSSNCELYKFFHARELHNKFNFLDYSRQYVLTFQILTDMIIEGKIIQLCGEVLLFILFDLPSL